MSWKSNWLSGDEVTATHLNQLAALVNITAITGETPAGTKNGVNKAFTTANNFRAGTTAVYLNGLREFEYTETGSNQLTFGDAPLSTDSIRVDYLI